jgi:hypothetical protein
VLKKLIARKQVGRVGKGEVKIMILILYFLIFGSMGTATNTYLNVAGGLQTGTNNYIFCERMGVTDFNCRELLSPSLPALTHFMTIALMALILWPVVVLIVTFDPAVYKKCKTKPTSSTSKGSTTKTTSNNSSALLF